MMIIYENHFDHMRIICHMRIMCHDDISHHPDESHDPDPDDLGCCTWINSWQKSRPSSDNGR